MSKLVRESSNLVKIVAICGLTILEVAALWAKVDGILFGLVIAGIAGIAGYTVGRVKK